jgi:hypothetical protein
MRASTYRLLEGTVCKILGQYEKVRYYLERAEDGGSSVYSNAEKGCYQQVETIGPASSDRPHQYKRCGTL